MCQNHKLRTNQQKSSQNKRDPARLGLVRKAFVAEVSKRFKRLKNLIWQTVSVNDALGLRLATNQPAPPNAFDFATSAEKIEAFLAWLQEMVNEGILSIEEGIPLLGIDARWADLYIRSAYQQGVKRAFEELLRQGHPFVTGAVVPIGTSLRDAQPILESFAIGQFFQPIHADTVRLIYTRTFNELKGVTDSMAQKMSRILAQALAEGRNPKEIYPLLAEEVGISAARARTIARTEMIRAHHVAGINSYREAGVEDVLIVAEWATSGVNTCPDCADLEGRIFTLDEIYSMIPLHPNCRCVALPANVGEDPDTRVDEMREDIIGDEYFTKSGKPRFRNFYKNKTGKNPPPRSVRRALRRASR